jgi:hypothetical protein
MHCVFPCFLRRTGISIRFSPYSDTERDVYFSLSCQSDIDWRWSNLHLWQARPAWWLQTVSRKTDKNINMDWRVWAVSVPDLVLHCPDPNPRSLAVASLCYQPRSCCLATCTAPGTVCCLKGEYWVRMVSSYDTLNNHSAEPYRSFLVNFLNVGSVLPCSARNGPVYRARTSFCSWLCHTGTYQCKLHPFIFFFPPFFWRHIFVSLL